MSAIVVIIGFYYVIKFLKESRKDKKYEKDMDETVRKIRKLKNDLCNNSSHSVYYNYPITYSYARPFIYEAIAPACQECDVSNSSLFGRFEKAYSKNGRKCGNDEILTGNAATTAIALIMSKNGKLPPEWTLSSFPGMRFYNPKINDGSQRNKEIYSICKTIQRNLRDCGIDVHVVIKLHMECRDIISNTETTIEEFNISRANTVRIDDIPVDRVVYG